VSFEIFCYRAVINYQYVPDFVFCSRKNEVTSQKINTGCFTYKLSSSSLFDLYEIDRSKFARINEDWESILLPHEEILISFEKPSFAISMSIERQESIYLEIMNHEFWDKTDTSEVV